MKSTQTGKCDWGLIALITCVVLGVGSIMGFLYWAEVKKDRREQMKVDYIQQVRQQIDDHAELKGVDEPSYIFATIVANDTDPTVGCLVAKQYDMFSIRYTKNISNGEVVLCDDVYKDSK